MLLKEILVLIASGLILAKTARSVIRSSVILARITRLSELVMGSLLLSIVSAFPELFVSLTAAASGNVGIAVSSVIGSNITSLCFVLGIVGILRPVVMKGETLRKLIILLFFCFLATTILLTSAYFRFTGVILLSLYLLFVFYSLKKKVTMEKIGTKHPHLLSEFKFAGRFYKHFLIMLVGLIILNLAARFIVTSASNIARIAGVAESFIGGTIISICATLPELSIALESIREGHVNLGIGDTVGECLTNSTLALGLVLLLSSFSMDRVLSLLMIFFLFSVALLCFFLTTLTRGRLEKVEGFFLLIVYLLFLTLSSVLSFFA